MFNKKRTGIKASAYPQRVQDTTTDNPVISKVCHLHTCLGNNFFRSITSHIRFFCLLTMHGYFNVFRYIQWDTLCASVSNILWQWMLVLLVILVLDPPKTWSSRSKLKTDSEQKGWRHCSADTCCSFWGVLSSSLPTLYPSSSFKHNF